VHAWKFSLVSSPKGQMIESAAQYNRTRGQRPPDHLGEES
jgi:hypothetical protein